MQLQCIKTSLSLFRAIFVQHIFRQVILKQLRVSYFLDVHFETAEAGDTNAECFQPSQKLGICGYSVNS